MNDTVKCSHYQIMQCIILRYPNNDDIYQRLSRDVLFLININILYLMILEFNISYMTHSWREYKGHYSVWLNAFFAHRGGSWRVDWFTSTKNEWFFMCSSRFLHWNKRKDLMEVSCYQYCSLKPNKLNSNRLIQSSLNLEIINTLDRLYRFLQLFMTFITANFFPVLILG